LLKESDILLGVDGCVLNYTETVSLLQWISY